MADEDRADHQHFDARGVGHRADRTVVALEAGSWDRHRRCRQRSQRYRHILSDRSTIWLYGALDAVAVLPLMVLIQLTSARIGRVTGKGIASNMRAFGPKWLVRLLVLLLAVANTINNAADLAAMGTTIHILVLGQSNSTSLPYVLVPVFSSSRYSTKITRAF